MMPAMQEEFRGIASRCDYRVLLVKPASGKEMNIHV